jgi:ferredoxin-thioredoxin reductase catalytic subunit
MSDEWFNEGVSCLPDKENAGQYSCQCRKPFIESMVDGKVTCTCPEGFLHLQDCHCDYLQDTSTIRTQSTKKSSV